MNIGYIFAVTAALSFGMAPTALTMLMQKGIPNASAPFYAASFLCVCSLMLCLYKKHSLKLPKKTAALLILVGMFGMGATTSTLATSYVYIPAGTATVIHFLFPTIVTIASIAIFKQRPSKFTLPAIICSISGMLFISVIGSEASDGALPGYLWAITSAFTYSFYMIANERLGFKTLPTPVSLCYLSGSGAMLMLIRALISNGEVIFPQAPAVWINAVVYCAFMGGGYLFLNLSISRVGAVSAAFATLLEPITSVICSILILGSPVTVYTIIGFALILTAVWLNSAHPPLSAEK